MRFGPSRLQWPQSPPRPSSSGPSSAFCVGAWGGLTPQGDHLPCEYIGTRVKHKDLPTSHPTPHVAKPQDRALMTRLLKAPPDWDDNPLYPAHVDRTTVD